MHSQCPQCKREFKEDLHRCIIPCREGDVICFDCLNTIWNKSNATINTQDCCLLGAHCNSERKHAQCPTCGDVFHIQGDNIDNVVSISDNNQDTKLLILRRSQNRKIILVKAEVIRQLAYNTIEELGNLKSAINKVANDCRISKISGSCAGIVGGALSIVGLALAIPSLGASAPLMIAGGVVSGLGGATALGANIAEFVNTSNVKKKTNDMWDELIKEYTEVVDLHHEFNILNAIYLFIRSVEEAVTRVVGVVRVVTKIRGVVANIRGVIRIAKLMIENSDEATSVLFKSASNFGRALHIGGIVLSGVAVVFDVVSLVWNSIELGTNKPAEYAAEIDRTIKKIREVCIDNIKLIENSLKDETDDELLETNQMS